MTSRHRDGRSTCIQRTSSPSHSRAIPIRTRVRKCLMARPTQYNCLMAQAFRSTRWRRTTDVWTQCAINLTFMRRIRLIPPLPSRVVLRRSRSERSRAVDTPESSSFSGCRPVKSTTNVGFVAHTACMYSHQLGISVNQSRKNSSASWIRSA